MAIAWSRVMFSMSSVGNDAAEMPHFVPLQMPRPTAPRVQLPGSDASLVKPPSDPSTFPTIAR